MTKKSFKKRAGRKLIAIGLILVGLFILVDLRVRPIIEKITSYQCQSLAVRIINETIAGELENGEYGYSSLIRLTVGGDGAVSSIESNVYNINKLKAQSVLAINQAIADIPADELGIAIGTISGINMFYGQGPKLPVKLAPKGYANAELISAFSSAGINQTLHRIIMNVTVDMSAFIPGYTRDINISTDFVIAETVIVGEVPGAYTGIISGSERLINQVSDYGANADGSSTTP